MGPVSFEQDQDAVDDGRAGGGDGEIIAPGFRLYSPNSEMGAIGDSWVINGRLPREGLWRMFNHYDLQGKLVAEGLLRPEHCDSELGMFCVYPPDEETARLVGAWLNERLSEGKRKLVCEECAAIVADELRHANWHDRLNGRTSDDD